MGVIRHHIAHPRRQRFQRFPGGLRRGRNEQRDHRDHRRRNRHRGARAIAAIAGQRKRRRAGNHAGQRGPQRNIIARRQRKDQCGRFDKHRERRAHALRKQHRKYGAQQRGRGYAHRGGDIRGHLLRAGLHRAGDPLCNLIRAPDPRNRDQRDRAEHRRNPPTGAAPADPCGQRRRQRRQISRDPVNLQSNRQRRRINGAARHRGGDQIGIDRTKNAVHSIHRF